jgi:hypothetical protein
MRSRLLNVLIVFTAILWAVWVVHLLGSSLQDPRPMPLIALPILGVTALIGWFLLAVFKANKRPA